jgi:hypothetical protein
MKEFERRPMSEKKPLITADHYRALQRDPIVLPSPGDLLDYIVETLVAKGLAQHADADPFREQLPSGLFLLVPPRPGSRTIEELLAAIRPGALPPRNLLRECDLRDVVEAPAGPYLMIDVEDGHQTRGDTAATNEGRSPFLVWEGIVHAAVFPMVFQSHELILGGTEHRSGAVPTLCLAGGRAELRACWYGTEGYPLRGAPTCALRVGAPAAAVRPPSAAVSPA